MLKIYCLNFNSYSSSYKGNKQTKKQRNKQSNHNNKNSQPILHSLHLIGAGAFSVNHVNNTKSEFDSKNQKKRK